MDPLKKARTVHWEDVNMSVLRKLAKEFGVDQRGLRKAELIHEMRVAYWKKENGE